MIKDNVLIDFIRTNHSPERAKLILEAIEVALTYNVPNIIPVLEEIVLDSGNDTMGIIDAFKMELIATMKDICRVVGVIPYQEQTDFVLLSKILSAMDKSVNEYYADYILENTLIGAKEETELNQLYSLAYLIEKVPEMPFYEVVHSIAEGTMVELETILDSKVIPDIETDDPKILERYRQFIQGRSIGYVTEYIRDGGRVGLFEHEALLAMFSEPILALAPADRPYDIVSAVLISDADNEEIETICNQWADYFSDDPEMLRIFELEIAKLLKTE